MFLATRHCRLNEHTKAMCGVAMWIQVEKSLGALLFVPEFPQ